MTREQAINSMISHGFTVEQAGEIFKAVTNKPTTKNDLGVDCISRDEVCRYVAEFVNHEFSTREEEELIDNIITGIERMPSVTPQEPKTGHWILDETDNSITCDRCGCLIWANDISNGEAYYCPNCGAKMESEECDG